MALDRAEEYERLAKDTVSTVVDGTSAVRTTRRDLPASCETLARTTKPALPPRSELTCSTYCRLESLLALNGELDNSAI